MLFWRRAIQTFLVTQTVNNLPSMQETWFQSLGLEEPLGKGMATYSFSCWRIPWVEEPFRLQSMGLQRFEHNWVTHIFTLSYSVQDECMHIYAKRRVYTHTYLLRPKIWNHLVLNYSVMCVCVFVCSMLKCHSLSVPKEMWFLDDREEGRKGNS